MFKSTRHTLTTCLAAGLISTGLISNVAMASDGKHSTYGWVEKVTIDPSWGPEVKAKLDTGALTSSMQAENIEEFERDGEDWVRFDVEVEDESTDDTVSKTFEREVVRKLALSGAGGEDSRPAVLMTVCIGGEFYEEQFSLRDRDDMIYPVLLGRRTIQDLGAVDVTQTFMHDADCDDDSPVHEYKDKEYDEDIGT